MYYLNMAGQEFPLRTNLELVRILKLYNGTNDIGTFPMPSNLEKRVLYHYKRGKVRPEPTKVKKKPPPFQLTNGVSHRCRSTNRCPGRIQVYVNL
jgi:hypothetical protein